MTREEQRQLLVWADWAELPGPVLMGTLFATPSRGKEILSFEYDPAWLESRYRQEVDPELKLVGGQQYAPSDRPTFGIFLDSSPDRWGRVLMQRREEREARRAKRKPRVLRESDYLLGVHDQHRIGALRFRLKPDGPFLDDRKELAAPPLTSLRDLEFASLQLEREGAEDQDDYDQWLRMLIAPGASLGGARPKASVIDPKGALWIAKFPSQRDGDDVGAWEMTLHRLAKSASIDVAASEVRRLSPAGHTFLARRFDRTDTHRRLHFASAMTLLGHTDGDDHTAGASYLELADFLIRQGAAPDRDLEQLWRRIVFFMCVSNADDHLRNHGFLHVPGKGWHLAPAYDLNPVPTAEGLVLNVSENDNALDLALADSVAPYFRVKKARATQIRSEVQVAVRTWRRIAKGLGIPSAEQNRMSPAFRLAS